MDLNALRQNLAGLSPEKRAIVESRLKAMGMFVSGSPAILPRDRSVPCALSSAQQRLWFLDQLEPNSCVYNIPMAVRLRGALHVAALRQALDATVARHEALRTIFILRGEEPVQVVAEPRSVELPITDLSAVPAAAREAELERALRAEARRPFNLAADLMLRALLVRLEAHEHVLLLTVHHIASDGWSMGILAREVAGLYTALAEERSPTLPSLPIQYGDYAMWQRRWRQGAEYTEQLAYWKAHLAGVPATLQLPTARPRPAVQTYRGARESALLPSSLADALRGFSRRERVTLFMTLLGAFHVLLHRYTGLDDVVVSSAIAGRRHVETEPLIGFFVNTLVLRADLSGDPPYREFLGRVREMVLGAYDHQDLPFEKLVEELRPERSLSWTPLVQVMFTLDDDRVPLELPGLTESPMEVDTQTAKFDLTLSVRETPQGLNVILLYNTELYDPGTIKRMLGHYEMLLEGIVADPGQRLSRLPLLTQGERHQLLVGWNNTQAPYPADAVIPELFEAQVARSPEAVAVTFEGQSLTYRQLNQRANQLAHHLRKLGVGPEVLVGLCLERSLDLIVGVFGILKAGGAYVPLDPADPRERLGFMLQDAGISVLVTHQRILQRLPALGVPTVCLDTHREAIEQEDHRDPFPRATADHLCYVMYTSGSTGRPKGVMITHRSVSNLLAWFQATFPANSTDVLMQKTPVTFDVSVGEFFRALVVGARLVIARPEGHRDCKYLIETICAEKITHLSFVPSLLQAMLEEPGFERCTSLRFVSCGGEAVPRGLVDGVRSRLNIGLINLYGPTEATVDATYWIAGQHELPEVVPIGRPIANTQAYILDARMEPVPIGVPGELYVGGVGLARGYLGRPELTAERFLPDPFSAAAGARLYKTGDLARYRSDGNIEYLGRLDHQVKLRGFRIELGEIEATLCAHPEVREAVVVAREDAPGDKRLVAYIVPHQGAGPTVERLRGFLQTKLPEYMVPAAFVVLTGWPLTSSGKVDRARLPVPETRRPEGEYVAPRGAVERELAEMWEQLLRVRPVGATDDFFELGGHSLLAGRVLARVRERFRVEVSLRAFFAAPTVAGLATAIVQSLVDGVEAGALSHTLEELHGLSDEDVRDLLAEGGG